MYKYFCYVVYAPGRNDDDAITNLCACSSEKERDEWVQETKTNFIREGKTVAKIEEREGHWIVVDSFGLYADIVCAPGDQISYR